MSLSNNLIFFIAALITGALIPIQAQTNAGFSRAIGSAQTTGLMVFVMGVIVMSLYVLVTATPLPKMEQLTAAPWYSYLGGLIVPIYVISITLLVPRIGVGAAIGLIVTGQILCAVAIDHFGFFNAAIQKIDIRRTIGVVLMIAGVYFVMGKKGN
ncbi:MAG TPA: DMT family transporter [Chitinophagales bacterium]|nr:DMT family transporter [Chitinophagales bacterium]